MTAALKKRAGEAIYAAHLECKRDGIRTHGEIMKRIDDSYPFDWRGGPQLKAFNAARDEYRDKLLPTILAATPQN